MSGCNSDPKNKDSIELTRKKVKELMKRKWNGIHG
jgi:hypothetical protein